MRPRRRQQQTWLSSSNAARLLLAVTLLACCAGPALTAAAAANSSSSLPEGLDSKPLIEQLLARKAFLAQHMLSDEWKEHVQQQLAARSGPDHQAGVLIVAGGRDMFANAAITLTVLRRHIRSSIPVEIVHFGTAELPSPELLTYLSSLNGTSASASLPSGSAGALAPSSLSSSAAAAVQGPLFITDALAAAPSAAASAVRDKVAAMHRTLPEGFKSFPAKVYALTHVTRFRKVLLLDADSMPLVDPSLLFQVPIFQRTGSLFWPDLWYNAWVNDTIYTLVGDMQQAPWVGNKHHRLVDSGQVLLDRQRHAEVLEYLWLLNSHHEWVYKHMHGDKDTFLLAFSMAGRIGDFQQVPCFTRDAMRDIPGHEHKFHHLGMVQSIPPAMLGAAMRGAAAAGSGASGDGGSRSSGPAPLPGDTGGRRLLDTGAAAARDGSRDSSSSSSSSSRTRDSPLQQQWQQWQLWPQRHLEQQIRRRLQQPGDNGGGMDQGPADDEGSDDKQDGDDDEDDAGRPAAAADAGPRALLPARRDDNSNLRHVGVPVFFHRTSFNSKFFPDCLSADKIRTGYCEVEWVSVPLSNEQAGHSLKPHMFAWNDNQIDTQFYAQHCSHSSTGSPSGRRRLLSVPFLQQQQPGRTEAPGSTSSAVLAHGSSLPRRQLQQQSLSAPAAPAIPGPLSAVAAAATTTAAAVPETQPAAVPKTGVQQQQRRRQRRRRRRRPVVEQFGLPPEHACDKLPVGQDVMPIPVIPISQFPYMQRVLQASYAAFAVVRERAGVKV